MKQIKANEGPLRMLTNQNITHLLFFCNSYKINCICLCTLCFVKRLFWHSSLKRIRREGCGRLGIIHYPSVVAVENIPSKRKGCNDLIN